jgi:hypothetical protein
MTSLNILFIFCERITLIYRYFIHRWQIHDDLFETFSWINVKPNPELVIVILIAPKTDHDMVLPTVHANSCHVGFIKGRLKF